ncbi:hypothetical protein I5R98_26775, partial [Pseudomonas asiatica]|nr:hypothetical protein [Pseudomonas asiatica]
GESVVEGDGLKLTETQAVTFSHATDAQVLVFDLRAKESAPSRKQSVGGCKTQACARRR